MALDIFFAEDIRNALLAANEASAGTALVIAEAGASDSVVANLRIYREGYKAALCTMALAFGLSPAIIGGQADTQLAIPEQQKIYRVEGR